MKLLPKILVCLILGASLNVAKAKTPLDFDGDGKSDVAVTRNRNENGTNLLDWYIARSSDNSLLYAQFGLGNNSPSRDEIIPADYDGDNKTDLAVWRKPATPGQSIFYILQSSDSTIRTEQFGLSSDLPAIGDYDGDNKADVAVYRDSGAQYYFIYRGSLNNPGGSVTYVPWGNNNARFYPGDFDGDGKNDFCVRLGNSGTFALLRSSDSGVEYINWGFSTDGAAPGDYDGDGRTDFGVYRINGTAIEWYILERDGGGTGANPILWGQVQSPFDTALGAGDYDGDGKSDIGVYRSSGNPNNTFFIRKSSDGGLLAFRWGIATDTAVRE